MKDEKGIQAVSQLISRPIKWPLVFIFWLGLCLMLWLTSPVLEPTYCTYISTHKLDYLVTWPLGAITMITSILGFSICLKFRKEFLSTVFIFSFYLVFVYYGWCD